MKIYSWNVNGIRSVFRKNFLDWIKSENPDIVCLQETKSQQNDLTFDIKLIDGYESYFCDAKKKGYSGTAVYTKIKPKKVFEKTGIEILDNEGRTQMFEFENFVLLNVYFPNGKANGERFSYKMKFYDEFLKLILKLKREGKNVVFCGDVNTAHKEIDLARPKENKNISGFLPIERHWLDRVVENGFVDTFRLFNQNANEYSWWSQRSGARSRNIGWRIDYFFVNKEFIKNVKNAQIHQKITGSDHCPICIELRT